MTQNDGGLAFPGERYEIDERSGTRVRVSHGGMSLRDYFAAKAMQGYVARGGFNFSAEEFDETVSTWSYEIADAMIKARNK